MRESVIYQEILEEGIAKGKAEGKTENARNVAIKLLTMGMSLQQISQITELSIPQIEVLQKEIPG